MAATTGSANEDVYRNYSDGLLWINPISLGRDPTAQLVSKTYNVCQNVSRPTPNIIGSYILQLGLHVSTA